MHFFLNLTLFHMTQGLHNVVHTVAGPSVIVFTNLLSQVVNLTCWSFQLEETTENPGQGVLAILNPFLHSCPLHSDYTAACHLQFSLALIWVTRKDYVSWTIYFEGTLLGNFKSIIFPPEKQIRSLIIWRTFVCHFRSHVIFSTLKRFLVHGFLIWSLPRHSF